MCPGGRGAAAEAADRAGPRRAPAGSVLQAGPAGALQEEAGGVRVRVRLGRLAESAGRAQHSEGQCWRLRPTGRGGRRESGQRCWGPVGQ